METVAGWFAAQAIARVPRMLRLAFGSVDFMSDSGIQGEGQEMNSVRTQLVLVSRLAGIAAAPIDDAAQLEADVRRSRRFGFGAKLCIHPDQVAGVAAAFTPGADELAWARRVRDAVCAAGGGVVNVDGRMVDGPVVKLAERLLAQEVRTG